MYSKLLRNYRLKEVMAKVTSGGFFWCSQFWLKDFKYQQADEKVCFCHPKLVLGSQKLLILRDAEINSA
jgi:hypothetical protein